MRGDTDGADGSKIGVLYLMPWLIVGGAENQMVQLLKFMNRERFRPVVCCIREPGALLEDVEALGIANYCLSMRPKYGMSVFLALEKIRNIIREENIQILQAMEFNARVLGVMAAKMSRVPVNIAAEHYTGEWQEPWFKKNVKRLTMPFVDRVVCVAEAQRRWLIEERGFAPGKLEVIYNGIDLNRFDPHAERLIEKSTFGIPVDSPVIGIVAALRPEKAHHVFLNAAKRVAVLHPGARFMIVGDGITKNDLEELSLQLGIGDRTVFTGMRSDIPDLLSLMDIVVLSSYPVVETFPVSLLEAMAMERPVVSTKVSGVPEMVEDGKNGLLVPVGDDAELAAAICRLLDDPGRARTMGREGRRIVEENFTIQKTVSDIEALYLRLLAEKKRESVGT